MPPDAASAYLRWAALRTALWRGYWAVMSVRLVVDAELSASQLVLIGAGQSLTVLAAEVPAGVFADTVSRRGSLVVAQLVTGAGMVLAGAVTGFPLLLASQCLCGVGWAFASGADVAWLSDELRDRRTVDAVLAAQARRELVGGAAGIAVVGLLAGATTLALAVVVSGVAMVAVGAAVARWPERGIVPVAAGQRWREARGILRAGARLARSDRVVLGALVATFLLEGGSETYGRLLPQHLLGLGFARGQGDPVVWFTALGLVSYLLGALVLRAVTARIHGEDAPQHLHAAVCVVGVVGLLLFTHAPSPSAAVAGALLVTGVAGPIARVARTIWVDRRAAGPSRATVHSIVSQAEQLGEGCCSLVLAAVAGAASATVALTGSAVLVAGAAVTSLAARDRARC